MKYFLTLITLLACCITIPLLFDGCKKKDRFYGTPLPFPRPAGFPQPGYKFISHPATKEGFELGRKLFYEGRLSLDGNFPCSSCHQQAAAFTTKDHDLGHGYNNAHTRRNPLSLSNLAWFNAYNFDGSAETLEQVALGHIASPMEMAETMDAVVAKLARDTAYQRSFQAAYGGRAVTADRILDALSQFVINLVSANSKYDQVKAGKLTFNSQEQKGYEVFTRNCSACHTEPLFTDGSYRNTGLPLDAFLQDFGRSAVTGIKGDSLKFRVPSLRNIQVNGQYGHDGRFGSVRAAINHYRTGVVQSSTLDPLLKNGIPLNNAEVDELLVFLRTLTDSSFLTNPRFASQ